MDVKSIDNMSTEELETYLNSRREDKRKAELKARTEYEEFIEKSTSRIVGEALNLHLNMETFFTETTKSLQEMKIKLNEYGEIKSNSKGGFSRVTRDGKHKIVYRYTTISDWDERAEKAESLLRDFLADFVKKRDIKMYNIISALLERNTEGNLEYSRIQSLYSRESEFDDPRWKEAIKLFKESYRAVDSKMRIEVYERSAVSQKWQPVSLNLSSF